MRTPTPAQVQTWRDRLAAHTMRDGECPVCKVPHRCRPWADAFGDLLTHGFLPEPGFVPETTPPPSTGGNPTAGVTEGAHR
ncbi:hypothetical protein ABZY58_11490 [Micromonospora tulbaghiae]|uniref:hypothetical protein n=1 Tax=Micromonospora tulbaghiae TaxID=479978 RepID=UPI0033B07E0A